MLPDPIILVDVSNISYKCHFTCGSLMYEGRPTGMVHGFLKTVLGLQKLSSRLVFCWDNGIPTQRGKVNWRKKLYHPYKATRTESKDRETVNAQMSSLHRVLRILGYPCIGIPGLECDDIMGLLTARKKESFLLFTSDDDMYQLLEEERVRVLHRKGEWSIITQAEVESQFGFPIKQWPIYLALGGDKSDCIRPIPGCGEKGAINLVLAGADPQKPFRDQPWQAERYAQFWESGAVRHAFQVAHIPRTINDWRIAKLCVGKCIPKLLDRNVGSVETSINLFVQFCSQLGLMEHIANRYRFFAPRENNGEGRTSHIGPAAPGSSRSHRPKVLAQPSPVRPRELRA